VYAGRAILDERPELRDLWHRQSAVVARGQLAELEVDSRAVERHVGAGRWRLLGPNLVVLHRGPLGPTALRWAGVLNAGREAGVCAWTALSQWGFRGWDTDEVHVVVPRGHRPPVLDRVRLHESRRHSASDLVMPVSRPPLHDLPRAAIDAAAWTGAARSASGLLAAVVQQRLVTASALLTALETVGRVHHRRLIAATLRDIEGGADALSEIDLTALCAAYGLPQPVRQSLRTDLRGRRRYRDAEWQRWDGRTVVAEVDGIGHMEVSRWYDDLMRDAELARHEDGVIRVRIPAMAQRTEPDRVAAVLRSVLLP
jgi:hypothetical protein